MVRIATIKDVDILSELFHNYRLFYNQYGQEKEELAFLQERLLQQDSIIFVSYLGSNPGMLTGFCQVYLSFSSIRLGQIYILNDLFVAEPFRKAGYGKELLDKVIEQMKDKNAKKILLQTDQGNHRAQELYESAGFKKDIQSIFYEIACE